jgi:hypothetical protein
MEGGGGRQELLIILKGRGLQSYNPLPNALLKTKHRLLYLKTQSVPRSKHFSSLL